MWLLAGLVIVGTAAVVAASHTNADRIASVGPVSTIAVLGPAAPEVHASVWLNTTPLGTADLRNKVVLYDFWTFECVNCQHTLPYVKAWWARYAPDGLVVLSIHTPEFDVERDVTNVRNYVTQHSITFPVALDPERVNWDAFANHYWPHFYLYDGTGLRYDHIGEGNYRQTEDTIRVLLGVPPTSPRAVIVS